jgi:hypothetical protein
LVKHCAPSAEPLLPFLFREKDATGNRVRFVLSQRIIALLVDGPIGRLQLSMSLLSNVRAIRAYSRDSDNAYTANTGKFVARMGDVLARTWDLGFTAFGGPPVHFQIMHRRFVEGTHGRTPWIDERVVSSVVAVNRTAWPELCVKYMYS